MMARARWKHLCGIATYLAGGAALAQGLNLPMNYQLVLDNAEVRVLRVHYGPHEKVAVHDHPAFPTVFTYLNDSGVVRLSHVDGSKLVPVDRPPTHAGAFRIAPGRFERHSVENLGDAPSDYLRVELKSMAPGTISDEFRGPAPAQPLLTGTSVVYDNPALRVERVICDPGSTCTLAAEPAPSVLIAITPAALMGGSAAQMLSLEQPASWLPAGQRSAVRSAGAAPAQMLRIVLLRPWRP